MVEVPRLVRPDFAGQLRFTVRQVEEDVAIAVRVRTLDFALDNRRPHLPDGALNRRGVLGDGLCCGRGLPHERGKQARPETGQMCGKAQSFETRSPLSAGKIPPWGAAPDD